MKKELSSETNYQLPEKKYWQGRKSSPGKEKQYWHEAVKIVSLDKSEIDSSKIKFGILGYQCDEGVRRNQGREGAKAGPNAIREKLAKVALHFPNKEIYDIGNVECVDENMEGCQELLAQSVYKMLRKNTFPIVIGGGHDVAYGHFKGIDRAFVKEKRIGIINFDAHFDLRPVVDKPNSGTPFNQIFNEFGRERIGYFVIGIQQQSNTRELFEIAKSHNVQFATHEQCNTAADNFNRLKNRLDSFVSNFDASYVSIDLDGFSSAYAPGVSAPSPLGFTPEFFFNTLSHLIASRKVISYDIAELNPKFDIDNHTATLAARIVDFIVAKS